MDLAGWAYEPGLLDGIPYAHWRRGSGAPILLVHGIGPGTTGVANFGAVLDALSARWETHLIDLIGFGRSGRKAAPPYFDVDLWVRQVCDVLAGFAGRPALAGFAGRPAAVIGNSVGGALALKAAGRVASVRVVVAIGAPAERYAIPEALQRFWSVPRTREDLAAAMRPMTAAQLPPDPGLVDARFAVLADAAYRDYFRDMTAGSGQTQLDAAALTDGELDAVAAQILLLHGLEDRAVPPAATVMPLSARLRRADTMLLADCGHNLLWERTDTALAAIGDALAALQR